MPQTPPLADATLFNPLVGLGAAGAAAMLWAASTMLYSRAGLRMSPARMNLLKGAIACGLFLITLLLLRRPILAPLRDGALRWDLALLAASGILGIGVGDTAYFGAIRTLGPRQAALLGLLAVPATAAGGLLLLGETMPPGAWAGMAITFVGVAWVVAERRPSVGDLKPRWPMVGIALGLAAALCQAGGMLMNRTALRGGDLDDLWTATWRLAAGTAALALVVPLFIRRRSAVPLTVQFAARPALWRYLLPAMLMGTFGGIWLQQVAVRNAGAGPAQTLLSTTPIWILPLAAMAGERISPRAILGSLVAVSGVALLVWSRG